MRSKGPMGFDEHAVKSYAHFDNRVSYANVRSRVENPDYVAHHGWLPLISKELTHTKYDGSTPRPKVRKVAYASHLDRCIYQRYSFLLNERYNKAARARGIDTVAIAYRNNLRKSNIDFAHSAFAKMVSLDTCWIMVADFEGFFPSIDHSILKQRLRTLLGGPLPKDYYSVYKSATRYSQWQLKDLMHMQGLNANKRKDIKTFNQRKLAIEREQFREHVKKSVDQPWKGTGCGIPQGLPISGVLANIFMMEFDEKMAKLAGNGGGLFMRYSDDIILVMPNEPSFSSCIEEIGRLCAEHKLSLEPSKTLRYVMKDGKIYQLGDEAAKATKLQYLGFDFDGSRTRIRQKTVGGYYAKMRRTAKWVFFDESNPSRKRIAAYYKRFSSKGIRAGSGNFITYCKRAKKRFKERSLGNEIDKDISNHLLKMRRAMQKAAKRRKRSER